MQVVVVADVATWRQDERGSTRTGKTVRQSVLNDEAPDGLSFRVLRSQFQPGEAASTTPRHHHAFQQVRWAEAGTVNYAPGQSIPAGDVAYFPRGTYYGPQMKDQGTSIAIQFGFEGEHQHGEGWDGFQAKARQELEARGEFRDGVYYDQDPETGAPRATDSIQAIYEERYRLRTGKRFVVPPEGYEEPILMHTGAFGYYDAGPGVQVKQLGCFFDHPGQNGDLRLSLIRLSGGGVHEFGPQRAQIAWSNAPGLTIDGKTYPELTYLYSPRGEKVGVSCAGDVELRVTELPRLD
jgi:hypothetical protein